MQTTAFKGFRLSLQQGRLWTFQKELQKYRYQCSFWLDGPLDVVALQNAAQLLLQRHAILRTVFVCPPGMDMPMQVVSSQADLQLEVLALTHLSAQEQETYCEDLFTRWLDRPFDLEQGPLLRLGLWRLSEQRHFLLCALPALCADLSTMKLLIAELERLYHACIEHQAPDDEPLQYTDVSAWQKKLLSAEDAQEQRDYWLRYPLRQASERLPFARRGSLDDALSSAPDIQEAWLEPALSERLRQYAAREDVSLEACLLAVWNVLLWRLTQEENWTCGLARNGRFYEDLELTPGPLTRYVPLSIPLTREISWQQLVHVTHATLAEMDEEQYYFSWDTGESREAAQHSPHSFVPGFAYEAWPLTLHHAQLSWSLQHISGCQEPFALHLQVIETGEKLLARFQSDAAQISRNYASSLPGLFLTLVQSALEDPDQMVDRLPILRARQYEEMFQSLSAARTFTPLVPLHRLFEIQAGEKPQQLAVMCGEQHMTYRDLNRRANVLARALQRRGVGAGTLVAICMERSVEMITGLLAILKAGGAYLPVDPDQPSERILYILRDSQASLVLTQAHLSTKLPAFEQPAMFIQAMQGEEAEDECANLPGEIDLSSLAYVIYTSGSTGAPKGVMIRHASVVNYAYHVSRQIAEAPGLHFASVSTLAADLGNTSIFGALVTGGCLHVIPYEILTSGEQFATYARAHPLDVLKIVPSHLQALLASCPPELQRFLIPRRSLVCGGEPFQWSLLDQLAALNAPCHVFNHYGPTETTVGVLVYACGIPTVARLEQMRQEAATVPLGRPIANVNVFVLDHHGVPVPPGVVGELWIGGAAPGAGYLQREELTRQRFLPHPSDASQGMCYRTGDLVCITPGGFLEFMGRVDRQVKLRGFRIELEEIESVLSACPGVWECAVMLRMDREEEPQIVAYVVARPSITPASQDVHAFVQARLPAYMLPAAFVFLRQLPLTINGKVDWQALPVPQAEEEPQTATVPQTPTQELLVAIWQDVLRVPRVDIHRQFAELGGHSLLATQVVSRIRAVFGVELPLRAMFEAPTVATLAETVEHFLRDRFHLAETPMTYDPLRQDQPLSFAQQRLWFLYQLDPGSVAYIHPVVTRLRGLLNLAALAESLREIARRHAVLRTTFPTRDGEPVQHIQPVRSSYLECIDLRGQPAATREELVSQLGREEADAPFDFVNGPLWRVKLLMLDTQEHVLFITLHHITTDGWSNSIFIRELTTLYQAYSEGRPSPLPELPLQYIDFSTWQRHRLVGAFLATQLNYWRDCLQGAAPLQLPTDRPRPSVQTFHGARKGRLLERRLSEALKQLSQQADVTLFMTLLGAFQVLLYRYSSQEDILVGTPIANRNRAEIEGLIGFFVNTLVMRTDLAGNPTFRELLERVRETALGAYTHQDLPFEMVTEALQPERDLSRTPFFQVMFMLQNMPLPSEEFADLHLESLGREAQTAKFDLTMVVVDTPDGLMSGLEYNTDLFDAATIERMLSHWQTLLDAIVASPDQRIADLPLLGVSEYEQLVHGWNDHQALPPLEMCMHHLFEAQVASDPAALALICGEQRLTYGELNRQANHVARSLEELGVKAGDLVALYMDRSVEMVVGILGILKAGAAYVPLDPTYPVERLSFMLEDTRAPVILTRGSLLAVNAFPGHRIIAIEQITPATPCENRTSSVAGADLAYLIYTSGSTGKPKGVAITHQNGVAFLAWVHATFTPQQLAGVLASTSICFDLSIFELFGPLSWGGTVILVENVLRLLDWSGSDAITLINTVPSALAEVARAGKIPASVQVVNLAGEPLSAHLVARLYAHSSITHVYNLYGPSEDTTYSTCYLAQRDTRQAPSIGRALSNTAVYVLDQHLSPVPIGVAGELYISGAGLARGYFQRPELTAERFIPEPFSGKTGARMYRTGDRARYLPDGNLEFLGRIDHQVKVRGFRIEPGEIEHHLVQCPGVQEGVVVVHGEGSEEKRLVAHVVAQHGSELSSAAISAYLKARLPEYLVPAQCVLVQSLPLLPNGKVDRKALQASYAERETNPVLSTPRNELEAQLLLIWQEVLGQSSFGITDNFFGLGGHSLLAVRLVSRLRQHFEADFALTLVFQHPTIEEMALAIGQRVQAEERFSALVSLKSAGSKMPFFCVHPAGGTVYCYHALARHLSSVRPFYALQSPDLEDQAASFARLEEMAAYYIEQIRAVQSHGPYLLGGWSLGGVVAFEMARQLVNAGQRVALLALFDSGVPLSFFNSQGQAESFNADDAALARHLIERNALPLPGADFYTRPPLDQLAYLLQYGKEAHLIPENTDLPTFLRLERMHYRNEYIAGTYRPQFYAGKLTLFRAKADIAQSESELESLRPTSITKSLTRGWDRLAEEVELHQVDGTHASIVEEPFVKSLATLLDLCLSRANEE